MALTTTPSYACNPQLLRYLETNRKMWDAVDEYCADLAKTGKEADAQHRDKLLEFKEMATNADFRKNYNDMSTELIDHISLILPEILFIYSSRQKSLARVDDKCLSLEYENADLPEERRASNPLNRIRDLFASRIIIINNDTKSATKQAYQVANVVAEFFEKSEDFQVRIAAPEKNTGKFDQKKFPNIYVPKVSGLKPKYRRYFKDYISCVKENGYQSLHITITEKKSGFTFEIQIRTHQQHIHAELNETANHFIFRDEQNKILFQHGALEEVNFSKIKIDGVLATNNPLMPYIDLAGVFDSVVTYQNPKNW